LIDPEPGWETFSSPPQVKTRAQTSLLSGVLKLLFLGEELKKKKVSDSKCCEEITYREKRTECKVTD
jgi:hypothetical protein